MNQKSIKNQCKIHRKSIKNRPKMDQKSVLEGSRGALGGPWRPRSKKDEKNPNFWGLLGPSWGRLGGLLDDLGALLGRILVLLRAFWAVLQLSCRPLGLSWAVGNPNKRNLEKPSKTFGKSLFCASSGSPRGLLGALLGRLGGLLGSLDAVLGAA